MFAFWGCNDIEITYKYIFFFKLKWTFKIVKDYYKLSEQLSLIDIKLYKKIWYI